MEQDQAEAEKKRDEAAQHPRSEVKRVVVARVKAQWIESERESKSKCGDDNPPTQQAFFASSIFAAGQSLFGEGDGFLVIHVTHESEKAKDNGEDADNTEAGNNIAHKSPLEIVS